MPIACSGWVSSPRSQATAPGPPFQPRWGCRGKYWPSTEGRLLCGISMVKTSKSFSYSETEVHALAVSTVGWSTEPADMPGLLV